MGAKEELADFKQVFDKEFKRYLEFQVKAAKKISPITGELMEHIKEFSLRGGKRIRPALFYHSYIAHGGKDRREALKASLSIELSETYLLIHDDIMDNDILRRGGVTIHEGYRKIADEKFNDKSNPRLFGTAMGINAGDVACAMSNHILASAKFNQAYINNAIAEFNHVYIKECYGQTLDVYSELRGNIEPSDVIQVHRLKTVPYTFDGPIKIGAILAGANRRAIKNLEKFSVPLGTAFQMQDDILGMFGSEEKLGKPVISDLKEGKKTLLILEALKRSNRVQKEIVKSNLGNKNISTSGLQAVRKVVEDTGSLESSKRMAASLVSKAMRAMKAMKLEREGKEFLIQIAEYMIKRDY
jgi:geranylgeranyl diphosphate synthase type I